MDDAGCFVVTVIVILVIILGLMKLSMKNTWYHDGYQAGWCEGRGGQWIGEQCVDSLRVRFDSMKVT